jgi:hypothetical protein
MSELLLRQDVVDELEYEPSVDAAHIGVAVDKGVVTLTGHVASYAEKQPFAELRAYALSQRRSKFDIHWIRRHLTRR